MNGHLESIWRRLERHRPTLTPVRVRDAALDDEIASLAFAGDGVRDPAFATALKAGLHLWNESLDRSHALSQQVENTTGSYWHAIMHRMEPDYDNAAYWFRRVGDHPVFGPLAEQAGRIVEDGRSRGIRHPALRREWEELAAAGRWDPFRFLRLVRLQETEAKDPVAADLLTDIQVWEMRLLLAYTHRQAFGGGGDPFGTA